MRIFLTKKMRQAKICLFDVSFSDFPLKTVVLRINSERLAVFPDYYQAYVKAHLMETGYLGFASQYENESLEYLGSRWAEWLDMLQVIKGSILKELIKLPNHKKRKTLPVGFI